MNTIAILHFSSFLADILLIILVLSKRREATLNRLCALFISTFAVWSLFAGLTAIAGSAQEAMIFTNISAIGWCFAPAASLWFYLTLAKKINVLSNKALTALFVFVTLFFIYEQWTGNLLDRHVETVFGWAGVWSNSIYSYAYYTYFSITSMISIWLIVGFWRKAETARQKKQALLLLVTGVVTLVLGAITDALFRIIDFQVVPRGADILFMILGIGLVYSISKYGLMSITPTVASDEILSTMNESLILLDARGNIAFTNRATLDLLNIRDKELHNSAFKSIVADKKKAEELLDETRKTGSAINRELSYVSKAGALIPVLVTSAVIKQSADEIAGFVISAMDITERKRVEAEIRAQKELIDNILESIPSSVLVISKEARIVLANRAFYRDFPGTPLEVEGRLLSEVIPIEVLSRQVSAALSGQVHNADSEFRHMVHGRNRIFVASMLPMQKEDLLLVLSDVTDDRERQERLSLADRLASVGKMSSGIAHELNNPLTSIIGLSQLLLDEEIPAEYKEDLSAIYNEAVRASNVVKNLLTFARKHPPIRRATQIGNVIEDVLKLRAYEHRLTNIQVDRHFEDYLPDVTVDYFQMQQVFLNIILNAESAMSEANNRGSLTITTQRINGSVVVSFRDDGPGIAKEILPRIFDPFFTTKEVGKGTGLGLSICYGIVSNHNGKIYAQSEPGKGTEFVVELPVNGQVTEK
ncbi:MAG: ATP-binding protein [Dehalococcoidia bacterium]|nr:ATP-binding protein [Dehalococcoidia bacterium]MDD5493670.1 ATP-binding protein [Dehalococcoidia bacterium]